MEGLFAWSSMPSGASKKQLEDVRELFDELDHALRKFQMKTGADNQYITMILGAVMNDYRVKKPDISDFRWIQISVEHSSGTMLQSIVNLLWRSIGSVLCASLVWKLLTDWSNALAPKTLFSNFKFRWLVATSASWARCSNCALVRDCIAAAKDMIHMMWLEANPAHAIMSMLYVRVV